MLENKLLVEYLSNLLTTHCIPLEEFIKTIKESDVQATDEEMRRWYSILQDQDNILLNQITEETKDVLLLFKQINISDFTEREMKQYFTLETFINNLYEIGLLLDKRLAYINSEIENYSNILHDFYDTLKLVENNTDDQNQNTPIDNLISKLEGLRNTLKGLEDK